MARISRWAHFFKRLEAQKAAINIASYAGFGTIRSEVMGEDFRRPATPEEIERMRALLREEMMAGARGLATGLEYDPGIYSSREEVIALATEAASRGGRYISHVRSEDRWFWEAIDEIIEIGRKTEMPVQISHIKLALRRELGKADRLIEILDEARASGVDITADIYPYPYWESTLTVMFPDRDFENRETAEFALSQITTPEGAHLGVYKPNPEYAGKTLREISDLRGTDPATTLMDLIREAQAYEEKNGRDRCRERDRYEYGRSGHRATDELAPHQPLAPTVHSWPLTRAALAPIRDFSDAMCASARSWISQQPCTNRADSQPRTWASAIAG